MLLILSETDDTIFNFAKLYRIVFVENLYHEFGPGIRVLTKILGRWNLQWHFLTG